MLFQANSFSDLLDRLNMIEEIAAADQRRLKELNEAAAVVAEAKEALEVEKVALEATKEELNASQVILEGKREEADALLADLIAIGEEYEALLDAAELDVENLLNEISQKEEEYDEAKEREYQEWLAAWLATSVPPTTAPQPSYGGSAGTSHVVAGLTWLVPCNYTKFSKVFLI